MFKLTNFKIHYNIYGCIANFTIFNYKIKYKTFLNAFSPD